MTQDDSTSPLTEEDRSPSSSGDSPPAGDAFTIERGAERRGDPEDSILGAVEEAFAVAENFRPSGRPSPPTGPRDAPRPSGAPTRIATSAAPSTSKPSTIREGSLQAATPQVRKQQLARLMAGGVQEPDASEVIQILLEDPDPEVRRMAADALATAPTLIPLAVLAMALRDPDDRVRAGAVRVALGHGPISGPVVLPHVVDRLHPMTRRIALEALPALLHGTHVLREHDIDMLARAVGKLDPPPLSTERPRLGSLVRAIGARRIMSRLEGPEDGRLGAARLLLAEGSLESLQAVSQMAGDPAQEVRWSAMAASNAMESFPREEGRSERSASEDVVELERPETWQQPAEEIEADLIASLARGLSDPDAGIRRHAHSALAKLRPEALTQWADSALRDLRPDRAVLGAAVVQHLGLTGLAKSVLERAGGIQEEDRGPYLAAIASLGLSPQDLARLLEIVDPLHRQSAVRIVWQVGGRAVLPFLPKLLDDSAGAVRMAVLEVLSDSGDPATVGLAQRLLAGDSSAAVRATAVHALAGGGGAERLGALRQALADPDPDVRATAIEVLPRGFPGPTTELLLVALKDEDERVWHSTLAHLAEVPDRDLGVLWAAIRESQEPKREELLRTVERLRPERLALLALQNARAPEPGSRTLSVHMAARAGTSDSTAMIVAALEDPDPTVRRAAASAMSTLRTPLGVAALSRTLSDPQPEVRLEAVRALGVIDDDTVPDVLVTGLNDPEIRVREMAVETLARWRSPAVARRLAASLSTPDLQRAVGQVLERMGKAAIDPLVDVVTTGDRVSARAAGEILGRISGPRAFVADLDSVDPNRRRRAVEVLGAIGGNVAVDGLLTVLADPDINVRARAATLLGELGDARASRALKRMFTTDPVSEVAAAAELALRRLGELPAEREPEEPTRWSEPVDGRPGDPDWPSLGPEDWPPPDDGGDSTR